VSARAGDAAGLDAADWATLARGPLFAAATPEMIRHAIAGARVVQYEARQIIFSQGDPAEALYLVLDGWVKIYRLTPAGEEAVVGAFTRGESFAEPVFFLGAGYPANAEAASRARLLRIDAARFGEAIEREPRLASAILASIVQHTVYLTEDIASLKLKSAPRRLADFLLRLAGAESGQAVLSLPHEKTLLAGRLGMTPESLSRALAALREVGVETDGASLRAPDLGRLRAFARGPGKRRRSN